MKISETTSFPHPVLAPWSSDIDGATISAELIIREEKDKSQVSIHCTAQLNQPDIVELIQSGLATFGCYIRCQETGLRRLQQLGFPSGVHHFAPGALLGTVHIRAMVWTTASIAKYSPTGTHAEFAGSFDLGPGEILALDDEQIIEVTRPPLPSIESIFKIISSGDLGEGEFQLDTEAERITVRMGPDTYRIVQALRQTDDSTRAVVMNSLYVPVVMQVLDQLDEEGFEPFEKYRWLHPFRARCEQAGVELGKVELLTDAQRLLERPFGLLAQFIDEEEQPHDTTS